MRRCNRKRRIKKGFLLGQIVKSRHWVLDFIEEVGKRVRKPAELCRVFQREDRRMAPERRRDAREH